MIDLETANYHKIYDPGPRRCDYCKWPAEWIRNHVTYLCDNRRQTGVCYNDE